MQFHLRREFRVGTFWYTHYCFGTRVQILVCPYLGHCNHKCEVDDLLVRGNTDKVVTRKAWLIASRKLDSLSKNVLTLVVFKA